jgi:hypothetical protein
MKVIKNSSEGIDPTFSFERQKTVFTRAIFWGIPHVSGGEDIHLKLERYKKVYAWIETLESTDPKSVLTLDNDASRNINFCYTAI